MYGKSANNIKIPIYLLGQNVVHIRYDYEYEMLENIDKNVVKQYGYDSEGASDDGELNPYFVSI